MDGSEEPSEVNYDGNGCGSGYSRGGSTKEEKEEAKTISLRQWLDRPRRRVNLLECLPIFRQVVEAVSLAHSRGLVVGNVRPSWFAISSFNRVSFIAPTSCSTSVPNELGGGDPSNEMLVMESDCYTSPEEANGGSTTLASDVYRLGVILFELFCTFESLDEKLASMSDLRHRVLPPELLLKWPREASFCLWLLHPQPDTRPKMCELLQSGFLDQPRDNLGEHEEAVKVRREIEDQELLLEFLLQSQQRKQEIADKLCKSVAVLSADIDEILHQQSILRQRRGLPLEVIKNDYSAIARLDQALQYPRMNEDSSCYSSKKHSRTEAQSFNLEEQKSNLAGGPRLESHLQIHENVLSKSSRLMKNFKKLEVAYFSAREKSMEQIDNPTRSDSLVTNNGIASVIRTARSSVDDIISRESYNTRRQNRWMNPFLDGLCKYLSFSKLKVRASLKQGDMLSFSNLVCSLSFDRDKELFATAGVNKKIKIFECEMILNEDRDIHYPVVEMSNKSKLSCICWNNYMKSQIASSDFEGVVQVWDITRNQAFVEMREHERRVWSVDFSTADPTKLASGSHDGAVKLWNINQAGSIGTIKTKAHVCSVQFHPDSASSLAIGSADHNIYCYDLRNFGMPCTTLVGHTRTVSFIKYLDSSTIVSASTDNSLKQWDLSSCQTSVIDNPVQTFTGHTNIKNFVGLSISDGYIATGSETNEVFIYHKAFPMPVLSYKFDVTDPMSGQEVDDPLQFVSSVCWRGQSSTLLAANSSGSIKLLEMV
ncbi:protein SPA1-RELATED 3 isoform X1 [Typha latifolia]|uniref:protein SPA1-RELATED 3 isoform X1 n=1 Tax=Typha latifolia TaxID=4733 RepID=UPI003C2E8F8D